MPIIEDVTHNTGMDTVVTGYDYKYWLILAFKNQEADMSYFKWMSNLALSTFLKPLIVIINWRWKYSLCLEMKS